MAVVTCTIENLDPMVMRVFAPSPHHFPARSTNYTYLHEAFIVITTWVSSSTSSFVVASHGTFQLLFCLKGYFHSLITLIVILTCMRLLLWSPPGVPPPPLLSPTTGPHKKLFSFFDNTYSYTYLRYQPTVFFFFLLLLLHCRSLSVFFFLLLLLLLHSFRTLSFFFFFFLLLLRSFRTRSSSSSSSSTVSALGLLLLFSQNNAL